MRTTFDFFSAGRIVFGPGSSHRAGELARSLGTGRVFVLTDKVLVAAGIVAPVADSLRKAGIEVMVFDGGEAEPSMATVARAIDACRDFGPDGIVGLGGGSNMDAAKLAAVFLRYGGHLRDFVGEDRVPGPILPLICIPTTAGTGSEVSQAAVYTDDENRVKVSTLSQHIRPRIAIVDPLLSYSCPPKVTADSGIDALTHAIEAFTAIDNARYALPPGERSVYQGKNPLADLVARESIRLVGQFLRRAVRDGSDSEAREGMAMAGTLGGLAFSNAGVALVHAMEYPIGAVTHCSHGAGNGLLLPYVMRYNMPGREEQFAEIASLLGEDIRGLTTAEAAEVAIDAVVALRNSIGVPDKLRAFGTTEDMLPGFAAKAIGIGRLMRVNPRMPTEADILALYREAL